MIMEADCTRCKETFVPHGVEPEDLIHCETEAGEECGGIGIIQGAWLAPGETPETRIYAIATRLKIADQEQHALQFPNCKSPHCRYHHPELPLR